MFPALGGTYHSALSNSEIQAWLDYLERKESGVWFFKSKDYEVKRFTDSFSLRKRGGGSNGPIYPWIEGKIKDSQSNQIDLVIQPSYFFLAFLLVFICIMLSGLWLIDDMKINGEHRVPFLVERVFFSLFAIALPSIIGYFKMVRPMQEAEEWLIKKLRLRKIAA